MREMRHDHVQNTEGGNKLQAICAMICSDHGQKEQKRQSTRVKA